MHKSRSAEFAKTFEGQGFMGSRLFVIPPVVLVFNFLR